MQIGEKIRELRQARGLSQEALAEKLQVSRQAVSKWEKGISYPTTENLLTLAELFQVSVDQLAMLVKTEKEEPDEAAPQDAAPEVGSAAETASRPGKHRRGLAAVCVLLVLALAAGGLLLRRSGENGPAGPDTPAVVTPELGELSEFSLIWTEGEQPLSLSLGKQEAFFPFGRPLQPTAKETVYETDFGSAWIVHEVPCGDLQLTYSHVIDEGDEWDAIDRLATLIPGYTTPRGIGVDSTDAEVLKQYDGELVYQLKDQGDVWCRHDYIYVYSPTEAFGQAVLFYMYNGTVSGIAVEAGDDSGCEAYAVDNLTIFPIKNGLPDFGERREPEREPVDTSRTVYISLYTLQNDRNLSEEEKYHHRQTIYESLQYLDWDNYGLLGEAGKEEETRGELLSWLRESRALSKEQITGLLLGACRSNLDGWYAENYDSALAQVFLDYPEQYIQCVSQELFTPEEQRQLISGAAYGGTANEVDTRAMMDAAKSLEGTVMFRNNGYENWKLLMEKIQEFGCWGE